MMNRRFFSGSVNSIISSSSIEASAQPAEINIQSAEELNLLAEVENQDIIQDLYEIDGNLLIYVEHYLFVDSQLIVRTETEEAVASNQTTMINQETEYESSEAVEIVAQESIEPVKVETKTVRAHKGKGSRHTIYLARKI